MSTKVAALQLQAAGQLVKEAAADLKGSKERAPAETSARAKISRAQSILGEALATLDGVKRS